MSTLELHPLCTLFPRLVGAEFEALKADIIANGQREPITVHEGQILDGGNRYRACIEAGIEPQLQTFAGDDPVSFVFSANFHRRHLTSGQQAVIVARAQNWEKVQPVGRPEKTGTTAGLKTVADRVAQSGASERAQRMADQLARQSPELAEKVAAGEISLPKAHAQLASKSSAETPPVVPLVLAAAMPAPGPNEDIPDFGVSATAPVRSASFDRFIDNLVDGDVPDLEEVNVRLENENAQLREQIASLKTQVAALGGTDQGAQIQALMLERDEMRSLAASHHSDFVKANAMVVDYEKLLKRLRRAAGVEKNSELQACVVRSMGGV